MLRGKGFRPVPEAEPGLLRGLRAAGPAVGSAPGSLSGRGGHLSRKEAHERHFPPKMTESFKGKYSLEAKCEHFKQESLKHSLQGEGGGGDTWGSEIPAGCVQIAWPISGRWTGTFC